MGKMKGELMRQQEVCGDLIERMSLGEITEDDALLEAEGEGVSKQLFQEEYGSYRELVGDFPCAGV